MSNVEVAVTGPLSSEIGVAYFSGDSYISTWSHSIIYNLLCQAAYLLEIIGNLLKTTLSVNA